jgi:glycosyltransferase involved in cell wall biosynthesis
MKIAIADETNLKFMKDTKEHWENLGYEVKFESGASEILAQWADVYWVEWWSNNIHYLFNWYKEHPEAKKPKFIVRVIDWDFWVRGVRSQEMVDFVDCFVALAPHIEERLRTEKDDTTGKPIEWGSKLHLVRPGVNLDKFTLKIKKTDGFQLGMVLGDFWPQAKNHMGGLDIFTTLYREDDRFRLHLRGQHEGGQYWPVMYEHYLDSRGIRNAVTLYPPQEDMNEWYENIDILLHPGMKEAFSYAIAEAMAKGIPPVVNQFYGSEDIWGYDKGVYLYQTHEIAIKHILLLVKRGEAIKVLMGEELRKLISCNYPNEKMFKEVDKLLDELK